MEKDFDNIKLCRDPALEKVDMYELKTTLFENGKQQHFLLFVWISKMTLNASVIIAAYVKIQYLCNLLYIEALHQFDSLCVQVGGTTLPHSIE